MFVIDDPEDNDIPVYYRIAINAYPLNPIYAPGLPSPYEANELEDPAFRFADDEIRQISSLWRLDYEYVHIREESIPVPEGVPESEISPPEGNWRVSHKITEITDIPKPPLPNSDFGLAAIRLLLQVSNGHAAYLGEGLFRVKAPSLVHLAAGTGNWGSAEVAATIVIGTAKVTGNVLAGGGTLVAVGAGIYKWVKKDEIAEELEDCYQMTGAACIGCVKNTKGWKVNKWQQYAGYLAFGGAVLSVATGGIALGIIGAVAGVWAMAESVGTEEEYLDGCGYQV